MIRFVRPTMYIMRDQITEVKNHNITYIISSQNLHDCDRVIHLMTPCTTWGLIFVFYRFCKKFKHLWRCFNQQLVTALSFHETSSCNDKYLPKEPSCTSIYNGYTWCCQVDIQTSSDPPISYCRHWLLLTPQKLLKFCSQSLNEPRHQKYIAEKFWPRDSNPVTPLVSQACSRDQGTKLN